MTELISSEALHSGLDQLDGWHGNLGGIEKAWELKDFNEAVRFVARVAAVVDPVNHHPDVDIRWNKVTLKLVTHSAGGMTQADLDTAALLDKELEGF